MALNWIRSSSSKTVIVGLLVLLALWGNSLPSLAGHKPRLVGNSYVLFMSPDGGNAVLINGPQRVDKATYDFRRDAINAGVTERVGALSDVYYSGNGSIPYSDASVQVQFNGHAYGPGCDQIAFFRCDDYVDGNSNLYWWGYYPYYATAMQLTEKVWEEGCSVNVSAGGFSLTPPSNVTEADWDSGRLGNNDIWQISHYWNNVHFYTYCGRWALDQQDTSNVWFGYNAYSPKANSSVYPPV